MTKWDRLGTEGHGNVRERKNESIKEREQKRGKCFAPIEIAQ